MRRSGRRYNSSPGGGGAGGASGDIEGVTAGAGLTGGGTTGTVTLNVGAGTGITVNANDVAVDTSVIAVVARQVISGGGLTGGGTLAADRTLAVGAGTGITVNADDVAVDTSVIAVVARQIISGAGLTGGGTLAADRTLAVGAGTGITVNADDVAIDLTAALTRTAVQTFALEDAGTTTTLRPVVLRRTTSGTAAASLGVGLGFELEDASGNTDTIGSIDLLAQDPANASEDSAFNFRAMVAGTITDLMRVAGAGGVVAAPDTDATLAVGRMLFDSRTSDTVFSSHRDQTGTTSYGTRFTASGGSTFGCASGQAASLAHAGTVRFQVNGTGVAFFAATPVAQQTVGANVNNVAASGTTGQFDDFTSGVTYATDYAALHATVYQLCRSVTQLTVMARNYALGA